jgi:hypothetical protein
LMAGRPLNGANTSSVSAGHGIGNCFRAMHSPLTDAHPPALVGHAGAVRLADRFRYPFVSC